MSSRIPAVRHAALIYRRGDDNLALHLHFERALETAEQAIVLGELGSFVLNKKGEVYQPSFHNDIVLLRPAPAQGVLDESDYRDLLDHFGFQTPNSLSVQSSDESCQLNDDDQLLIVSPTSAWVH
jgi:hypothetical protein